MPKPSDVENTLENREIFYGNFRKQAEIFESLVEVMRATEGWCRLDADQKLALHMNALKVARILNGAPSYIDNWHDIQGYAKLVEDRLRCDRLAEGD